MAKKCEKVLLWITNDIQFENKTTFGGNFGSSPKTYLLPIFDRWWTLKSNLLCQLVPLQLHYCTFSWMNLDFKIANLP